MPRPRPLMFAAVSSLLAGAVARAVPGDPTEGRNPLDELVRPLAELNLEPDFDLSVDQKRKVREVRQSFAGQLAEWRRGHVEDFRQMAQAWDDLRNGRQRPGATRPTAGWLQLRERQQKLLATSPDPVDAQIRIEAVLTEDQRRRFDGVATRDPASGGGPAAPFGSVVLPVPSDGLPKAPGFYKLRLTAQVAGDGGSARALRMTYVLFLPQGYDPTKGPYPTLVFLHGSGEAGVDGNGLFAGNLGPAAMIRQRAGMSFAKGFPMILVCPQCPPRGERWDQAPVRQAALQVLDDAMGKVRIDPDRIYLTGLSMGGKGTWLLAGDAADRFAAIAPISASTLDLPLARRLRYESVWAIDGADDMEDGPAHNRAMVDAARDAGADAKVTILPHRGHYVWGDYYGDLHFYQWFLGHHRLSPAERQARDRAAATTRRTG